MIHAIAKRLCRDPDNMPAPEPRCISYDTVEAKVMFENHERTFEQSRSRRLPPRPALSRTLNPVK